MNDPQNPAQNTGKKNLRDEELKTEGPLSEKDEVKAAERKIAKSINNKTGIKSK